jgi:hypothetical protein
MTENRRRRQGCLSKARVTARLLLSFLALSPSAAYASTPPLGAPQNPILPPPILEVSIDSLSGEHDFVR